uniref:Uncharacterized protein n=1 Tax=Anguilla anguilla TaxID=7936 RepID=A0A0E9QHM6_ANGAN
MSGRNLLTTSPNDFFSVKHY